MCIYGRLATDQMATLKSVLRGGRDLVESFSFSFSRILLGSVDGWMFYYVVHVFQRFIILCVELPFTSYA